MIGAQEKSNNLDEIIVTSSPYVNSEYLRLYPGMTSQNLRENGIMNVRFYHDNLSILSSLANQFLTCFSLVCFYTGTWHVLKTSINLSPAKTLNLENSSDFHVCLCVRFVF